MTPAARRAELYGLLGDLPPRDRPITVETLSTEQRDGYVLEKLVLDLNGTQPVPAYYVRPANASGRILVVLYNHSHGGKYALGKDELFKGSAPYLTPYADAGVPERWKLIRENVGHLETPTMRAAVLAFLEKWLAK